MRLLILAGVLAAAIVLAVGIGAVGIAPTEALAILASRFGLDLPWAYSQQQETVLIAIRIPRVLASVLVGAAWAAAGVGMQGTYRTPLADPALVGPGAGAALGAALATGFAVPLGIVAEPSGLVLMAVGASLGALGTWVVIRRVASASGRVVVATMLLAGLILSAFLVAVTALVVAAGRVPEMGSVAYWTLGSLAGVVGTDVVVAAMVIVPAVVILGRLGPRLDALALGEAEAGHLGVDVRRLSALVAVLVAVLSGMAVAVAGVIAFVALVTPSLARASVGPPHGPLVFGSALLGATMVVLADVLARSLFSPTEIALGVVTTLAGAPFFLWLLLRDRGVFAR